MIGHHDPGELRAALAFVETERVAHNLREFVASQDAGSVGFIQPLFDTEGEAIPKELKPLDWLKL